MIHQLTAIQRALGQVINTASVSRDKMLVSGFSPQSPGFDSGLIHLKFMVDEMVLGHVFSPVSIIAPKLPSGISLIKTAFFWVITQRVVVVSYRRFGTTYHSHLQVDSWLPEMGPIDCSETSVINYHYWLCNNPEELSSRLLRGGSLKTRIIYAYWPMTDLKLNNCQLH